MHTCWKLNILCLVDLDSPYACAMKWLLIFSFWIDILFFLTLCASYSHYYTELCCYDFGHADPPPDWLACQSLTSFLSTISHYWSRLTRRQLLAQDKQSWTLSYLFIRSNSGVLLINTDSPTCLVSANMPVTLDTPSPLWAMQWIF